MRVPIAMANTPSFHDYTVPLYHKDTDSISYRYSIAAIEWGWLKIRFLVFCEEEPKLAPSKLSSTSNTAKIPGGRRQYFTNQHSEELSNPVYSSGSAIVKLNQTPAYYGSLTYVGMVETRTRFPVSSLEDAVSNLRRNG